VTRYHEIVKEGWPMPTIAGGVYAGELHAYYELLGPDVAYFVGAHTPNLLYSNDVVTVYELHASDP
jgi:hypothetical protein